MQVRKLPQRIQTTSRVVRRSLLASLIGFTFSCSSVLGQNVPPGGFGNPNYGSGAVPNGYAPLGTNNVGSPYTPIQNGVVQPAPSSPQPLAGGAPSYAAQPTYAPQPTYSVQQPAYAPPQSNNQLMIGPGPMNQPMAPLNQPWQLEPNPGFMLSEPFGYNPRIRDVPLDVYAQEGQTGRFTLGGSVNSDLGVSGQVILEERTFDILAWPNSRAGLLNGAF